MALLRSFAAPAILLLGAASAAAGPCLTCVTPQGDFALGWWDDRAISPVTHLAEAPRIDVDISSATPMVVAVWTDAARGDGDLVIATSPNGGCSWSIRSLTGGPEDDRTPDVAISATLDTVVVVFTRDGAPYAVRSTDGGVSFTTAERINPTATVAGVMRVAGVPVNGKFHAHAVWIEAGSLHHATSPDGGSPGSWISGPPISDRISLQLDWSSADVSVDTSSVDPTTLSGLTIVAEGRDATRAVREIFALRSNDSGATFYGDPSDLATLNRPRRVSDPRSDDITLSAVSPTVDGSDNGAGVLFPWNVVAWSEDRSGTRHALLDARAEEGATPSIISDWNEPPTASDIDSGGSQASAAAIAVVPNPLSRPPNAEMHAFFEDRSTAANEVAGTRSVLDGGTRPNVTRFCDAYVLTGQSPARIDGAVVSGSLSVDEDLSDVFAVWVERRSAGTRVYFKRTDTVTLAPTNLTATPGPLCGISVRWTPTTDPRHCDIDRYRIEYGLTPGLYTETLDVVGAVEAQIPAIQPATRHYIRVTAIDQACNQRPTLEISALSPSCSSPLCPNVVRNTLLGWRVGLDVNFTWSAAPIDPLHDAATSYDIWRSTLLPSAGYANHANSLTSSYTDPGASPPGSPGDHHFYTVVARNNCGTSADEPPP